MLSKLSAWLTPEQKSASIASPDQWLLDIFGAQPALSGASVTPESALRVPAVKAAIGLISETIGTLPAKAYRRTEGGKEVDRQHPAHILAHDWANPWTAASALREQLTRDAMLHGHGYAWANRVGGRPVELIRIEPALVTVEINQQTSEPAYIVREPNGTRRIGFRDMLHISAGPDGVAPIVHAREAIALALVLEQHAARLFGRGARPSGILKFPGRLTPEAAQRIREAWNRAHGGNQSGGTAVLEEGASFEGITLNAVDAQFAEMRAFQIVEIARAFRVSPVLIGDLGRATWSNSEELGRQFVSFTLLPWLDRWKAAYERVLLTPEERGAWAIEFTVDDLLRADTATRATAYSQFRAMGAMTANEIRALENLPPIAGGDTLENPFTSTGANADD